MVKNQCIIGEKEKEVLSMQPLLKRKISRKNSYQLRKLKEGERIPLVSSTMFETMLNNESRKKYLCYMLSLILEKDMNQIMENIHFVKQELDKENYHHSKKTVDLVCKLDDDIYNIELNNNMEVEGLERNISYAADLYKSKMFRGSDYRYQKVLQINITNFTFEGNESCEEEYFLRDKNGNILTDKIRILYFYLPKIREKYYNKSNLSEIEKLLLVFNEQESKELSEIMEGHEIMEEYVKESKKTSTKEEVIGLYDKELYDEAMEYHRIRHAREEGMEKGMKKEKIEIAKSLKEAGVDIEIIIKSTSLSQKEIENL